MSCATESPQQQPELVHIVWADSFGLAAGWEDDTDVSTTWVSVHTVGFVLAETNDAITVAPHVGYHGGLRNQVGGAVTIPKIAIVSRREITSSSIEPESAPTLRPTSQPSSTSDLEGSSRHSSPPLATSARSSGVSS